MWCTDCKRIAENACLDDHVLKSIKTILKDEVVQLQVDVAQLAELLPEALRLDDDDAREQAIRVLQLVRQPGATLEVSVRGQSGEAMTASWTNPAAAPAAQRGTAGHARAVATAILGLALAKQAVWQQRGADADQPAPELPVLEEREWQEEAALDLPVLQELRVDDYITDCRRMDQLLQIARQHRVRKLTNVWCNSSHLFPLELLQLAGPHLEQLKVNAVYEPHWEAVLAMPRLRRLDMNGCRGGQYRFPAELRPLPAHYAGLLYLYVYDMPREAMFSLVRAHAGTLQELQLAVGTPGREEWPWDCNDVPAALRRCGPLVALQRLELVRWKVPHSDEACPAQLSAVRVALPGVVVECSECSVRIHDF